jgi:hypothetical protein
VTTARGAHALLVKSLVNIVVSCIILFSTSTFGLYRRFAVTIREFAERLRVLANSFPQQYTNRTVLSMLRKFAEAVGVKVSLLLKD